MFDYFVSLGAACPVASSMSRYGLRSFSGVFDWLITPNFGSVLHCIETNFEDFLLQENLERYDDNDNHFLDKKSGFRFEHDVNSFENEYDKLKEKYAHRISVFYEKAQSRVCYLRSVRSEKDLQYIEDNTGYIESVIKKHNEESEIVFLCDNNLSIPDTFAFRYYKTYGIWSGRSRWALRSYFDNADDFLRFCGENYSGAHLLKNLVFDLNKSDSIAKFTEHKCETLTTLLSRDLDADIIPDKIIIYGAGVIGKELYKKVKEFATVLYFVDGKEAGTEFQGVKVIPADELQHEEGVKVIVSATYYFDEIKNELLNKYQEDDIISLDDILNLEFSV